MLILLIGLFFCHFLADYTQLSSPWMLKAKSIGSPLLPIFVHALVHATLMLSFMWVLGFDNKLILKLYLLQLISHFLIDVWKGKMNIWFPSVKNNMAYPHWILFGFDQFLHSVVIITMTYFLLKP